METCDEPVTEEDKLYKGLVTDPHGKHVARAWRHADTIVVSDESQLNEDLYTLYYEGTVLKFYRYNGFPMIGTDRHIDIKNTNIRHTEASHKRYMDMIYDAISFPWRRLCMKGKVNVFMLVDKYNQVSNLYNVGNNTFMMHGMTLFEKDGNLHPHLYSKHKFISGNMDKMTIFSREGAYKLIENGYPVVGFNREHPDIITKYYPPSYAEKREIVGVNRHPINRWHRLMDRDPRKAKELHKHLPPYINTPMDQEAMLYVHYLYTREVAKKIKEYLYTPGDYKFKRKRIYQNILNYIDFEADEVRLNAIIDTYLCTISYKELYDMYMTIED